MSEKFEDIFKERFEQFEAEADSALFDKIVEKRKRRGLIIWWQRGGWVAAAILLLFLVKFGYDRFDLDKGNLNDTQIESSVESEALNPSESPTDQVLKIESDHSDDGSSTQIVGQADDSRTSALDAAVQASQQGPIDQINNQAPVDEPVLQGDVAEAPEEPLDQDSDMDSPIEQDADDTDQDNSGDAIALDEEDIDFEDQENEPAPNTGDPLGAKFYPSPWSIELSAGPGYAYRSLSGNPQLIDWRNETESPALSYQLNVAVVRELSRNWSFRTGVMVTQRMENFNFEQTSSINKYTSLAVPFEMDNRFYKKKNFSMSARLGLMFRVHEFKDGLIRVGENDIEPISDMNVERSGYIAMNFGMGLAYRVSPRVELLAQPQWSHSSSSTFNDQNDLAHRDYGFFTRIGLRVNL